MPFELLAPKAVIKGVFSRSYCYYGDLLCHENDNNVFSNDWAVGSFFFDIMIEASSDKTKCGYKSSKSKFWKLF